MKSNGNLAWWAEISIVVVGMLGWAILLVAMVNWEGCSK